jgi:hypothetical protein
MQKKVVEVSFTQKDMDFLLNCIPKTGEPNPIMEWLPNQNWYMVQRLIELDKFSSFS